MNGDAKRYLISLVIFLALVFAFVCLIKSHPQKPMSKKLSLTSTPQVLGANSGSQINCTTLDGKQFNISKKQCSDYDKALGYIKSASISGDMVQKNWETEADLPVIEKNKHYDFVLLGSSHARIFSRYNNQLRVEKILGEHFINLSQGGDRAGIISQQTYLRYFYDRGNSADTLLYFVDPFIFFNSGMDDNIHLYDNEPFRLDFYSELLVHQPRNSAIIDAYLSTLFSNKKIASDPEYQLPSQNTKASSPSATAIDNRLKTLYKDSYDGKKFKDTLANFMATLQLALNRNAKVILIIPTTLIPKQSVDQYVFNALESMSKTNKFKYYNESSAVGDPALYSDTDHLNTNGVIFFTEDFLKPILK